MPLLLESGSPVPPVDCCVECRHLHQDRFAVEQDVGSGAPRTRWASQPSDPFPRFLQRPFQYYRRSANGGCQTCEFLEKVILRLLPEAVSSSYAVQISFQENSEAPEMWVVWAHDNYTYSPPLSPDSLVVQLYKHLGENSQEYAHPCTCFRP